ncbi:MAG: MMPL family transporter, partial [Gammaproteobacteria bacterium]
MVKSYGEWLTRWRYLILLLCMAVVVAATSGAQFLTFKTDYRAFFSSDNPQLRAFEQLQNTYTKTDNVLFVLAPRDGRVFTPETLASVSRLTEACWQIPYSIRVDSISNYQYTEAEGDDLIVADLIEDPQNLAPADLQRIHDIAVNEPLLVNRLISPDGAVTGVNVTIQLPDEDSGGEVPEITAFARKLAAEIEAANPNLDVYLTGLVIMNNSFPEVMKHDQKTLVPLMFGIVLLMLVLLLRSVMATLASLLVIVFSIATAMGLAGWLGIALTPPSIMSTTIILTLAVADCVHILVSLLHAMHRGYDRPSAMIDSLRINLQPVFLTSLTTVIGFLSMNFSDAPPFRDLGNIVAM